VRGGLIRQGLNEKVYGMIHRRLHEMFQEKVYTKCYKEGWVESTEGAHVRLNEKLQE
jgi:hypothetical protein